MSDLSIIKWYRRNRPQEVHSGEPIETASAKAWVKKLNAEYPTLFHWIEPLTPATAPEKEQP